MLKIIINGAFNDLKLLKKKLNAWNYIALWQREFLRLYFDNDALIKNCILKTRQWGIRKKNFEQGTVISWLLKSD